MLRRKQYYADKKKELVKADYSKFITIQHKKFIEFQMEANKLKMKYMSRFEQTFEQQLVDASRLKEIEWRYFQSSSFNYGVIEGQIREWIKEGYRARQESFKNLGLIHTNLEIIDERLDRLYGDIDVINDELAAKIDEMSFHSFVPDVKGLRNEFLDVNHSDISPFTDLEAYTLYINRVLDFHCNLLNQAVLYDLFEGKQLIKRFKAIKAVFTGEHGDILSELAGNLLSYSGFIKAEKLYQINVLFNQILPARLKKHLNFIFVVKEIPKGQRIDFLKTKLNTLVTLKSDFDGSLRILFNEKTLNVFFEILAQLLKISKIDQLISKTWTKLPQLQEVVDDQRLFRKLCLVARNFVYFLREYQQYIYHFVIESAFKTLVKNSKTALSFNELFNVS